MILSIFYPTTCLTKFTIWHFGGSGKKWLWTKGFIQQQCLSPSSYLPETCYHKWREGSWFDHPWSESCRGLFSSDMTSLATGPFQRPWCWAILFEKSILNEFLSLSKVYRQLLILILFNNHGQWFWHIHHFEWLGLPILFTIETIDLSFIHLTSSSSVM